jgi:iron(III) transport system substrate-binding protein
MMIRKNALAGIALAASAALGLAACGGSPAPAGSATAEASNGEITVYNAQHESLTKEWADAFTAETGIKVTLRQGSDTEMSNQIVQEGAASPADVFLTENSPAMGQVENAACSRTSTRTPSRRFRKNSAPPPASGPASPPAPPSWCMTRTS